MRAWRTRRHFKGASAAGLAKKLMICCVFWCCQGPEKVEETGDGKEDDEDSGEDGGLEEVREVLLLVVTSHVSG